MPRFFLAAVLSLVAAHNSPLVAQESVIDIGDRLELFVDDYLIERLNGLSLKLHHPQAVKGDSGMPAKGAYVTVLKDGDLYRSYFRLKLPNRPGEDFSAEYTCYLESRDGIRWSAPDFGLIRFPGAEEKNIILAGQGTLCHNFTPFIDTRPGVPEQERYKAVAGHGKPGLYALVSPDGIRWEMLFDEPIITEGMFDSQNVAFWSEAERCYVCYFRTWTGEGYSGLRTISRSTSADFRTWSEPVFLYANEPGEHLYVNGTHPYFRAPHLYIALATRFLPERGNSTEIVLMSSRGGAGYDRTFLEAFIRPGLDPQRWGNRANYAAWQVVPTGETEMSIYVRDLRFVLRTDGFVSVHADYSGGMLLTKPFVFQGDSLVINCATSAAGSARFELRDRHNQPIPGFTLNECQPFVGDAIRQTVRWTGKGFLRDWAGTPVRLFVQLNDADLYALQFFAAE
ncbi:hypothetical protein JW992_14075 [candidate division KSB1 bacterium]|nr:hypothetical protein [candidate division KSB1 bacterium]